MKGKLKKLLRLFLVFLSSFALVCFCLPAKATAQDFTFDGNTSTSFDLKANAYNYFITKLHELYDSLGTTEDWANFCEEHGVDILTETINYNNNFVLDVMAQELSAATGIPEPFLHLSTELSNIDDIYQNSANFSERGKRNYDKFKEYYTYANLRGGTTDIKGTSVTTTNWANSQELYIYQIRPDVYCEYDGNGAWQSMTGISYQNYLGTYSHTYDVPETIWGYHGSYYYNNGDFTLSAQSIDLNNGFNINPNISRCFVRLGGLYNGTKIAVFSQSFGGTPIVPVENCHIEDNYIIAPNDINNSEISFYIHLDSCEYANFHIYTENFDLGGMTAPATPIFEYPDKNSPYYDREVREYNYYNAAVNQLLDDMSLEDIGKILESVDDYGWFTFPLEMYRDISNTMLNGYQDYFVFDVDEIDLSFVADGLKFPARRFSFYPDTDLDGEAWVLFWVCRYIIAFGYLWALVIWGRSLILRIGSDTIHCDYEDD